MNSVQKPSLSDVLLGRGVATNRHPGNERFRAIVSQHIDVYVTSSKKQKSMISRSIVDKVKTELNPPGRFLTKNSKTGLWQEVHDRRALEKTAQALRDGAAPLRKQLLEDMTDPGFLDNLFEDGSEKSKKRDMSMADAVESSRPLLTKKQRLENVARAQANMNMNVKTSTIEPKQQVIPVHQLVARRLSQQIHEEALAETQSQQLTQSSCEQGILPSQYLLSIPAPQDSNYAIQSYKPMHNHSHHDTKNIPDLPFKPVQWEAPKSPSSSVDIIEAFQRNRAYSPSRATARRVTGSFCDEDFLRAMY